MGFHSKKKQEGEFLIDHRASPGMPTDEHGMIVIPGLEAIPAVGEGEILELKILCCNHCQTEMVLHPKRTRERAWCPGCDRYICDRCEVVRLINGCNNIKKQFDKLQEENARNLNIQVL